MTPKYTMLIYIYITASKKLDRTKVFYRSTSSTLYDIKVNREMRST